MSLKQTLTLEQKILGECAKGNLELPSLPDIALQVKNAINDPSKGLNQIAKLIEMDPNIAARVIKIANSSMFAGYKLASSCAEAVARLGLHVIKNIVICVAVNNLFATRNSQLQYQLKKILDHSRRVGAISYVIGKFVADMQAEKAMLAGLISQIGAFPVINYLNSISELNADPQFVDQMVKKLSGPIGSMILQQWNFDEDLINVPENATNWFRNDKPKADYADIIVVANIHSMYGRASDGVQLPALIELPAFEKLGISQLGPQASLEILNEAEEDIRQASKMLLL